MTNTKLQRRFFTLFTSFMIASLFSKAFANSKRGYVNLALGKPTTQSSTHMSFSKSSKAVDGNRNSNFWARSCSHTNHDNKVWWMVDLAQQSTVYHVVIFNRMDCCSNRLEGLKIKVGNDSKGTLYDECGVVEQSKGRAEIKVTCCRPLVGRFVRLELPKPGVLTLCELEVMGEPIKSLIKRGEKLLTTEGWQSWSLAFDIRVFATNHDFSSILDIQSSQDGRQIFAINLLPFSTFMSISAMINGTSHEFMVRFQLPLRKYNHIHVQQKAEKVGKHFFSIFIGDKLVYETLNSETSNWGNVDIFSGSPHMIAAKAHLKNFVYKNLPEPTPDVFCSAISHIENGHTEPSNCQFQKTKKPNDICQFQCNEGFVLNELSATFATCSKRGTWDLPDGKFLPQCQKARCPKLLPISTGQIFPESCVIEGAKIGESCHISCNPGFDLVGDPTITCDNNGHFDRIFEDDVSCAKNVYVKCPNDFSVELPKGQDKMQIGIDRLGVNGLNLKHTESYPPGVLNGTHFFTVGTNSIRYTAANRAGVYKTCQFRVTVLDKEPPTVHNCDVDDLFITIKGTEAPVSWPKPKFTDNVKVENVIENMVNRAVRAKHTYSAFYAAKDTSGNSVDCKFKVHVRAPTCTDKETPGGDGAILDSFNMGEKMFVRLLCPHGTTFSINATSYLFQCLDGDWKDKQIPDCVEYKPLTHPCPAGTTVTVQGFKDPVCSYCPKGTFEGMDSCIPCPITAYQDEVGQTSCKQCPDTFVTPYEGARAKYNCHVPAKCLFNPLDSDCERCSKESLRTFSGQQKCQICPASADDPEKCKVPAKIVRFTSRSHPVNVKLDDTIEFECLASGSPYPSVVIQRADGSVPSHHFLQHAATGNKLFSAAQLRIKRVQSTDAGVYRCYAKNVYDARVVMDMSEVEINVIN